MPLETILLFVVADLMICLTPGPATMVTVSHALPAGPAGGMRGALGPIVGVNVGNFIWYALTAFRSEESRVGKEWRSRGSPDQ